MGSERISGYLTGLYERLGDRYLARIWHVAWAVFLLAGPIAPAAFTPYLRLSWRHALQLAALTEVGVVAMMLVGSRIWVARERVFRAWWRAGRPAESAVGAWKVVGGLRLDWLVGWPLGVVTVGIPTTIYALTVLGRGVGDSAVVFAAWVGVGGYAALLGFFAVELCTRPVLRDAAARMPPGFDPGRARVPIARRLFAALLMISGSTGFFLSFGLSIGAGSLSRLALGLGLTTAFTLTTALLCTVVITGSTAGSVADLLAAIRQIRAGDLRARVLISSQDEFGLLAASFNEMTDDLQRSQARIVASADAARRRVERDLHDGAQQQLVLVKLKLGQLRNSIRRDASTAEGLAADLVDDLDRALAELRDLARGIYPALLETDGLRGALAEAAARAALPTTIECDGATRYPREIEAAVYFCCLEALQNAAKHAGKDAKAAIALTADAAALQFEVSDDGAGFDAAVAGSSSGIQSMTDRVGAHGGQLRVRSSPGHGTSVVGTIPLDYPPR